MMLTKTNDELLNRLMLFLQDADYDRFPPGSLDRWFARLQPLADDELFLPETNITEKASFS